MDIVLALDGGGVVMNSPFHSELINLIHEYYSSVKVKTYLAKNLDREVVSDFYDFICDNFVQDFLLDGELMTKDSGFLVARAKVMALHMLESGKLLNVPKKRIATLLLQDCLDWDDKHIKVLNRGLSHQILSMIPKNLGDDNESHKRIQ